MTRYACAAAVRCVSLGIAVHETPASRSPSCGMRLRWNEAPAAQSRPGATHDMAHRHAGRDPPAHGGPDIPAVMARAGHLLRSSRCHFAGGVAAAAGI